MSKTKTLSADDLADRLNVDRATVYRWHKAGILPAPEPSPGRRGTRWSEKTIRAWESQGFVSDVDQWRKDLRAIWKAVDFLRDIERDNAYHEWAQRLAATGCDVLLNSLTAVSSRRKLAKAMQTVPWDEAVDPDRATINAMRTEWTSLTRIQRHTAEKWMQLKGQRMPAQIAELVATLAERCGDNIDKKLRDESETAIVQLLRMPTPENFVDMLQVANAAQDQIRRKLIARASSKN